MLVTCQLKETDHHRRLGKGKFNDNQPIQDGELMPKYESRGVYKEVAAKGLQTKNCGD